MPSVKSRSELSRVIRFYIAVFILSFGVIKLSSFFYEHYVYFSLAGYLSILVLSIKSLSQLQQISQIEVSVKRFVNITIQICTTLIVVIFLTDIILSYYIQESLNSVYSLPLQEVSAVLFDDAVLFLPMPLVIIYILFFDYVVNTKKIYDLDALVHRVYDSKYQYDSVHNFLYIVSNTPYCLVMFLFGISGFFLYSFLAAQLGYMVLSGVNMFNLLFCFLMLLVVINIKFKKVLRLLNHSNWSVFKMYVFISFIMAILLLTGSYLQDYFIKRGLLQAANHYNMLNSDVLSVVKQFKFGIWWFFAPIIAFVIFRKFKYESVTTVVWSMIFSSLIVYLLFSNIYMKEIYQSSLLRINNTLGHSLSLVMSLLISYIIYTIYKNSYNDKYLSFRIFDSKLSKQKNRNISRAIHSYIVLVFTIATMALVENIMVLSKLACFFGFANIVIFSYYFVMLRRLT